MGRVIFAVVAGWVTNAILVGAGVEMLTMLVNFHADNRYSLAVGSVVLGTNLYSLQQHVL
jgi:hypothetical protein